MGHHTLSQCIMHHNASYTIRQHELRCNMQHTSWQDGPQYLTCLHLPQMRKSFNYKIQSIRHGWYKLIKTLPCQTNAHKHNASNLKDKEHTLKKFVLKAASSSLFINLLNSNFTWLYDKHKATSLSILQHGV